MDRYMRGMSNGGSVGTLTMNGLRKLEEDELRASVPSIFAEGAHESRSDRFAFVSTADALTALQKEGFGIYFAQQANSRISGKADFTKHMVRMRHDDISNSKGEAFEVILVNGHDGTSSWQMFSGVFRFICANGLMTGDMFDTVKVSHRGDAVTKVVQGAYQVLSHGEQVMDVVDDWKCIQLDDDTMGAYGQEALKIRFDGDLKKSPIAPHQALWTRREGDRGLDLWSTYNRAQENMIRGGGSGMVRGKDGRLRNKTIRKVTGIDQAKKINDGLWNLTANVASLAS